MRDSWLARVVLATAVLAAVGLLAEKGRTMPLKAGAARYTRAVVAPSVWLLPATGGDAAALAVGI